MSVWQAILIAGWLLAITLGRGDLRIASVMAVNFAVTMAMPKEIGAVGISDILCAAILLAFGRRGQFIAMLYLICAAINAVGNVFQWPSVTTYAILDPIGWLMLVVLGNGDSGVRRIVRSAGRFLGLTGIFDRPLVSGNNPSGHVAVVSGQDQGLTHRKEGN